jgi:hypothetical protein
MKNPYRTYAIIALLVALCLTSCAAETDRTEKPSPDWSRGLLLGTSGLRQPIALQADDQGHVHLVWYDESLHYAHLDPDAQVLVNQPLALDPPNPRRPQLLADQDLVLHLAWLSRDQVQTLYHTTVAPDGTTGAPRPLTGTNTDVSAFSMYAAPDGEIHFVLSAKEADGSPHILHTDLGANAEPTLLVGDAIDPYAVVGPDGTVHVTWVTQRSLAAGTIFYATLSPDQLSLTPPEGQKLTDFEFSEGGVYYGPVIGLTTDQVYVIWSVQSLGGGLTPTAAFSYYIAFPYGEPSVSSPQAITLPPDVRPLYRESDAFPALTQLASLEQVNVASRSDFVNAPSVPLTALGGLPVALSLLTESSAESQIQSAVAVLDDGGPVGYALSSDTGSASVIPTIAADPVGNLHLAWLDVAGFGEFSVYYATVAPQARRWLDRTTSEDLALGAADILFGVLSGVGLLPVAGIWSFPAMIWVVVFFILSGQEEMDRTPTKIGFSVGVAIYVGMKVLLLPGLFAGTPFLHLFPPGMATAVGIAVPLLILGIALLATYSYVRRAERATIFKSFLIFALVDVALTLILYAPGFFGGV